MATSKCIYYRILFPLFFLFTFTACSQERSIKNLIYIYNLQNGNKLKDISVTEIKNREKIKTFNKNIGVKNGFDNLNKSSYVILEFKDLQQFDLDKTYELMINRNIYRISDFKINPKNRGSDIIFHLNGIAHEIGDDNIIKIEYEK